MAGYTQYLGTAALVFGPLSIEYGPKGSVSHFTVTCAQIGPLINYYNYIVQYGASGSFKGLDRGVDGITQALEKELTVSVPGLINNLGNVISELYFDQWELLTNEATDTIFANPLLVGGNSPILNYNDKVVLSRMARTGANMKTAVDSCNLDIATSPYGLIPPTVGAGPFGGGKTVAGKATPQFQNVGVGATVDAYGGTAQAQIAVEIQKTQTEYESPTYTLRHTSYCSATQTYNNSIANTQKIYTPAQLLSECGSGWTYNLPPRLYSKIASIPIKYAPLNESPYYSWGWLKRITREPVMSNFMVEVSTEYSLGLWSNLRYENAT